MKYLYTKLIMIFLLNILYGQTFSISRVHYGGGGDWYSDPSSIPNLLKFLTINTKIKAEHEELEFSCQIKSSLLIHIYT